MNDRVLVEALRAGDPGALAALYDAHAESVYRYCRCLLRDADSAQVALRDALIAAEAHAGLLADPGMLRPWLYALARSECRRRRIAGPQPAGEALAGAPEPADPADADLRIMAWNAVQSLPAADREVLELDTRHGLSAAGLAAVLGIPARRLDAVREQARDRLRDAVTAEILAMKGPYDCPRRARILTGFAGELTPDMREHLVRHLARCETCSPHRSRQVSAAKVFELLPQVTLPESLRVRVLSCFVDPELFLYRRYVARRSQALDGAGFPLPGDRKPRVWPRAVACTVAAVTTLVAIAGIFEYFGKEVGGLPGVATAAFPPEGKPPVLPWRRAEADATAGPELGRTAGLPLDVARVTPRARLISPATETTRWLPTVGGLPTTWPDVEPTWSTHDPVPSPPPG
ncbi:RNA polymerase sigma factor, partial [Nonomuraea ferruginea]